MLNNVIIIFSTSHFLIVLVAYLLGSIPFGLVLTRLSGLGDIREVGSGNVGATNVLRTGNRMLALLTLILDAGKGGFTVLVTLHFYPSGENGFDFAFFAGIAAVLGHNFPIWTLFRGGKGVATTLGALLAIAWLIGLTACITWLVVAFLFRYSSLAGIVSLISAPLYAWLLDRGDIIFFTSFLSVLAIIQHRENIERLLKGNEKKIGKQ